MGNLKEISLSKVRDTKYEVRIAGEFNVSSCFSTYFVPRILIAIGTHLIFMSSHHFVKEGQEPALLIMDALSLALIEPLLEWAPQVIVCENALRHANEA